MNRNSILIMAAACYLASYPAFARSTMPNGWQVYTSYSGMRGLHGKPLIVEVHAHSLLISGKRMNSRTALSLLKTSQTLSPMPDILVKVSKVNLAVARKFMKTVSSQGLCSQRNCFYQVIK